MREIGSQLSQTSVLNVSVLQQMHLVTITALSCHVSVTLTLHERSHRAVRSRPRGKVYQEPVENNAADSRMRKSMTMETLRIGLIALLGMGFAACGGDDADDNGSTPSNMEPGTMEPGTAGQRPARKGPRT